MREEDGSGIRIVVLSKKWQSMRGCFGEACCCFLFSFCFCLGSLAKSSYAKVQEFSPSVPPVREAQLLEAAA